MDLGVGGESGNAGTADVADDDGGVIVGSGGGLAAGLSLVDAEVEVGAETSVAASFSRIEDISDSRVSSRRFNASRSSWGVLTTAKVSPSYADTQPNWI